MTPHKAANIYLKALPYQPAIIDLCELEPEQAQGWLATLLTPEKPGLLHFMASPALEESLGHIYTNNRNYQRAYGQSGLGIGFPLVMLKTPDEVLTAPLFIWPVQLEPEVISPNQWYIALREQRPVALNRLLAQRFAQLTGFDLEHHLAPLLPKPGWEALKITLQDIPGLWLEEWDGEFMLEKCPGLELAGSLDKGLKLAWSAVMGIFPAQSRLLQQEMPALNWPEQEDLPWEGHPFGLQSADPWQASAADLSREKRITCIEGGVGTGKRHLLLQLLGNALSNERKCLVISDKLYGLQEIQRRLEKTGLNSLCFLLRDPEEDYQLITDLLRAELQGERPAPAIDLKRFFIQVDKLTRSKEKLDAAYKAIHKPVLGEDNWTAVVGHFLRSNRAIGKELLSTQLQATDYAFSTAEYRELSEAVSKAYPLFQKVKSLQHPLHELHEDFFLRLGSRESHQLAAEKINAFLARVGHLLHRYISGINAYSDQLRSYLEDAHRGLSHQTDVLLDHIQDFTSDLGPDFKRISPSVLKMLKAFSSRNQTILQAREEVFQAARALGERLNAHNLFDFNTHVITHQNHIVKLEEALEQLQDKLSHWHQELPEYVQEETLRLSSKTIHPRIPQQEIIQNLEEEMDRLLEEMNASRLFQSPLEHHLLTLSKRQKYLENLQTHLEHLRLNLRDYDDFHEWQGIWIPMPEPTKKLIRALVNVKPADWNTALDSWYLHETLLKARDISLPQDNLAIGQYCEQWEALLPSIPMQILSTWHQKRAETLRRLKRNRHVPQQLLAAKRNPDEQQSHLADLFRDYGRDISDGFPIMLATADAALEVFREAPDSLFDLVLLDEAQNLPEEVGAALARLGERIILLGNPELSAKDEQNLLNATPSHSARFALSTIYRVHGVNPLQFLQADRFTDAAMGDFSTQSVMVNGVFDDHKKTNEQEANQVVQYLLKKLPLTPQRTYPSIGVVAFTPEQRDLISSKLMAFRRSQGQEADIIRQLERNKLGVFHLDELAGTQFDILIISATFDTPDDLASLDPPGTAPGKDNLHRVGLLLSRALKQIMLFHSFDKMIMEQMSTNSSQMAAFLLSNYLLLAKAWEQSDEAEQEKIIKRISQLNPQSAPADPLSVFWDELAHAIRPYLEPERIRRHYQEAHFHLPLVIRTRQENKRNLLLCADGFIANTPSTDYCWEQEERKNFAENGFDCLPVWSVNWWKNADQEARRLAGQIIRREQAPE